MEQGKTITAFTLNGRSVVVRLPDSSVELAGQIDEDTFGRTPEEKRFELTKLWLETRGYSFRPEQACEKPAKRPYHRHQRFELTPQNDKIELVPMACMDGGPRKYTLYRIVWKRNGQAISVLNEKGFKTNANKDKAILFTKADVGIVSNSDDFEFEAVDVERKIRPTDRIASRIRKSEKKRGK